MEDLKYVDENGREMTISVIGFFRINELNKEFVIYSMIDNDSADDMGHIILGEVIREDNNVQILGIASEEKEMVVAYYNEISNQIGGTEDE